MLIVETIADVRSTVSAWRAQGERIAFVPTMGKLHAGHLKLIEQARHRAERTVTSIFVNPLQFPAGEDFLTYPRSLQEDIAQLTAAGVDLLFTPGLDEIYPEGAEQSTFVKVPTLSGILCGAYRPGHFRGVATVVNKLFNIVQPQVALFGEKDYQQLQVIRRMTADLALPIEIIGIPTVRESDGLAMSSRNVYLGRDERQSAPVLYQTLCAAKDKIAQGERNFSAIEANSITVLQQAGFRPDYFQVCRADTLAPAEALDNNLVILTAAWLGKARLIDNVLLTLKPAP